MRLIDQTHVSPFLVQMYGPQPATDDPGIQEDIARRIAAGEVEILSDGALFPAPEGLPREVGAPREWAGAWGLLTQSSAHPSNGMMLGRVLPIVPAKPPGMGGCWCVWGPDGRLLHQPDPDLDGERLIDVAWGGSRLIELRWARTDADDYAINLSNVPVFDVASRIVLDIAWDRDVRLSAQSLRPLRAPTHWLVWAASGQGEAGFDVLEITARGVKRGLRMLSRYGQPHPKARALSPDGRWLVFASYREDGNILVGADLATGHTTTHPLGIDGLAEDCTLTFDSAHELVVHADGVARVISFPFSARAE
jgi:hypothetical protein